ncbi:MAG TPA: penicillin-binding protein 2 [Coriobacteriia bacterium]
MTTFRQQLRGRFGALGLIVLIVLGVLLARLWSMQVLSGATFAAQAEENRIRQISLDAPRGRILDVKGRPLVTNRPVMAVTAAPTVSEDATLVARLSGVIDVPVADIMKKLSSYKEERLKPRVLRIDVPMKTVSYLVEHAPEYPGIQVEAAAVREYPQGALAAHVLGYTGEISESQLKGEQLPDYRLGDIVGKAGVESEYDKVLQGEKGYRRLEVDSKGRVRGVVAEGDPRAGKDIVLTIDADVQAVAEQALTDAIEEAHRQGYAKSRAGAAVVLDVKTGAVVAMASAPGYDPTLFIGGINDADWQRLTDTQSEYPLNNRAIMGAYPPASTFKVVTGMAALQTRLTGAYSQYTCTGFWEGMGKPGKKCWKATGHGTISFTQGIVQSCDVVFYEVGKALYEAKGEPLQSFARSVGLGSDSGIDLPGEASGRVPDAAWKKAYNKDYPEAQAWLGGDTVNMAIGQGDLLVTPLQLANVYATYANGGKVMKPHVLKSVLDSDGQATLEVTATVSIDPHISPGNLAVMRNALTEVTASGTGKGAFAGFPIAVAGKTGTAQVNKKDDFAWFAAYAPAAAPRYAVAVVIEQGGHGGSVAGPAARQILSKLFNVAYRAVHTTDVSR